MARGRELADVHTLTRRGCSAAEACIAASRAAQRRWITVPLEKRLKVVARARSTLALRAAGVAALVGRRPVAETMVSELLPLLEAMRFVERNAARILSPRRHRRSRSPIWLRGVEIDIEREPFGVVLIIAPANYPLMLPAIQAVQALAAGNSVVVKPAPGGKLVADALATVLASAGLPAAVLTVVGESKEEAQALCSAGADKIVFTGSEAAGRAVLERAAAALTPVTLEMSGNDAAFVRSDADVEVVVAALRFGMTLNGGATCVAPRRVYAARTLSAELEWRLAAALESMPAVQLDEETAMLAAVLIEEAVAQGARLVCGGVRANADSGRSTLPPTVLADVLPGMRLCRTELFAPLLSVTPVRDDDESLACAAVSPYALGATVFGRDMEAAKRLARRVDAGLVVVNDAIVPSADPRAPLAPRGSSGFGVTRGAEGLLAMTRPKVLACATGRRPHLGGSAPPLDLVAAYIAAAYGEGASPRFAAVRGALREWVGGAVAAKRKRS